MILENKFTKEEQETLLNTKARFSWTDEMLDNYIILIDKLSGCNHKFTLVNDWIKTYGYIQMDAEWSASFSTSTKPITLGTLAKMKGHEQLKFLQNIFTNKGYMDTVEQVIACVLHKDPRNIPHILYNSQLQLIPEYNPIRNLTMEYLRTTLDSAIQKAKGITA